MAWQAKEARQRREQALRLARQHSPYLSRSIDRLPGTVKAWQDHGANAAIAEALQEGASLPLPQRLRQRKQKIALVTALADLCGEWRLPEVTAALSAFAEAAIGEALDFLIGQAVRSGMLAGPDSSGLFVLAMGKLGGKELNYSSDIDLIVLYDPDRMQYTGRQSGQAFASRIAQDLTAALHDRTADGYVFRTDLRLRPDPASTPLAVSTHAALRYYESVGQNWERAAMIKARVVAGDRQAGARFLDALQPFLWRTHLDFAATADILSIKRQMQSRSMQPGMLHGHNVKTGRGGIREIEFLAQIHQLIRGGRLPALRIRPTLDVLAALVTAGLIAAKDARKLTNAYRFLRQVEHRLQMRQDEQTHRLPETPEGMARLAAFCEFPPVAFERRLSRHLALVHHLFNRSFAEFLPSGTGPLGGGGQLVFTGVEPSGETLAELFRLGFGDGEAIFHAVADWHKGNRRCTRTGRSRELLTELLPEILDALGRTADPDAAFQNFDRFLTDLPSGVQLFSLFTANRELLRLVADLLGSAPALGETLSRRPALFDAVLGGGFFDPLPQKAQLRDDLNEWLRGNLDTERTLVRLQTFQQETLFRIGAQMLRGLTPPEQAGEAMSDLADLVIETVERTVRDEMAAQHGTIGGSFAIVALGRLGSRELTFGSDLDLIFLYDAPENAVSDGAKPLPAAVWYNRLAQRVAGRLTAPTRSGALYALDTRLRPFGEDGPLAAGLRGFERYYDESAWVYERLALTRARIVTAESDAFDAAIDRVLSKPVAEPQIAAAIADMRDRLRISKPSGGMWDVKRQPGGLMEVDFLLQYLLLLEPDRIAERRRKGNWPYLTKPLRKTGRLPADVLAAILDARRLQTTLLFWLRLTVRGNFDAALASDFSRNQLAQITGHPDLSALETALVQHQRHVAAWIEGMGVANDGAKD